MIIVPYIYYKKYRNEPIYFSNFAAEFTRGKGVSALIDCLAGHKTFERDYYMSN